MSAVNKPLVGAIATIAIIFGAAIAAKPDPAPREPMCSDIPAHAKLGVEALVKQRVKSPSSLEMGRVTQTLASKKDGLCTFVVSGRFEASNSFGAMLPGLYVADMEYRIEQGDWRFTSIYVE